LIKIGRFGASRHKLGYVRVLTPQGFGERARLMTAFLKRKVDEYEQLGAADRGYRTAPGNGCQTAKRAIRDQTWLASAA